MDKRITPRFKLDASLADSASVALTLADSCRNGVLLDISGGGFQVRITDIPKPPAPGTAVAWSIRQGELEAAGQGRVTRVDTRLDHSASIGIALDIRLSPDRGASFAALARQLANQEQAGAVRARTGSDGKAVVEILGKLNPRLNRDFTNLLRDHPQRVDLSKCLQIDSGGLGLLLLGMERGVQVEGCQGLVKELVETAGICKRCHNQQHCWGHAQHNMRTQGFGVRR
ncbi:MAG TPA: PilZ domain-containing protein [Azospira sp.]|nr:PilZ domain-containing protein [Azospira sp.]